MADAMFRPDIAGIREALSQPGVQAELGRIASGMAASASSAARRRLAGQLDVDPYRSYTTMGHQYGVALGIVTTATALGQADEARHKTLEGLNH